MSLMDCCLVPTRDRLHTHMPGSGTLRATRGTGSQWTDAAGVAAELCPLGPLGYYPLPSVSPLMHVRSGRPGRERPGPHVAVVTAAVCGAAARPNIVAAGLAAACHAAAAAFPGTPGLAAGCCPHRYRM